MIKLYKFVLVALILITQVGCSAFEFLIERSINNFERKTVARLNQYADFNDSQQEMISQLAADVDNWMRVERLSKVSTGLLVFADNIEIQGQISETYWRDVYQDLQRGLLLSEAPHLIDRVTELALTLSDKQATQIIETMHKRFEERLEKSEELSQHERNEEAIQNANWLFRSIDRPLKKEEKAQAVQILDEQKENSFRNKQRTKNSIEAFTALLEGRYKEQTQFQQELEELWVQAETPDTERTPEVAEHNMSVTYRCLSYLLSVLNQEERNELAMVLRDYAALFAELSES